LRARLAGLERAGLAVQGESYWIENMVAFRARPSVIEEIASREDVETVFAEPEVFYDPVLDFSESGPGSESVEPGLRAVNAHRLWRAGITGSGRIVMNIDTGVNGSHPALASRWRGTLPGVQPQHAWYNGAGGTFPVDSDNPGHGTHTMGIMAGCSPASGDTLGVAPGAYWIAGTGSYTGAFQWAADPDGNPFTLTDVPDVINCSWFTSGDLCYGGSGYWSLMDNVELLGAAVIWSAGNCGPGGSPSSCSGGAVPGPYMTITPPKNRIASEVNAFSVGALESGNTVASYSSRGPSACDTSVIKPEVSAPGSNVRSTLANGGYGLLSGTSMASPHVAGAVALLRQVNPNADADMVKYALLSRSRDLGPAGEDNSYGMGIIDVFAAAEAVSPYSLSGVVTSSATSLPIRLAGVRVQQTEQSDSTDSLGTYSLKPVLGGVTVAVAAFGYYDTTLAVTLQGGVPFTLNVALRPLPTAPVTGVITDSIAGTGVACELRFRAQGDPFPQPTYTVYSSGAGTYSFAAVIGTYRVEILPPAPHPDRLTVTGMEVTVSGATLNAVLPEAALLLVDDDAGAAYDTLYRNSADRLGRLRRTLGTGVGADSLERALASFRRRPVLVWFTGNDTTGCLGSGERRILVSHFDAGGRAILTGQNMAEFTPPGDTLYERYLGVRFAGNSGASFVRGFAGDVIGNGINYLISGGANNQTSKDIYTIIGAPLGTPVKTLYYTGDTNAIAGVRVLGANGWGAACFAFGIEGITPSRQDTFMLRSLRYFDGIVTGVPGPPDAGLPEGFVLEQNYPNPFNPATTIRFGLPVESTVLVAVYDLLGRESARLASGVHQAGFHEVVWNGRISRGEEAASGLYFCRLEAVPLEGGGGRVATQVRTMVLLK
ncbi:MAG: S8 family serine peptidase, partial [Bacteroidota bacterium]